MRFIRATILTSMSPSLSNRLQRVSTSGFHSDLDSLLPINRRAEELTYIPYSSFNGQSLTSVNSNTEGYGEISYFSLLSGRPRDNINISIYLSIYLSFCIDFALLISISNSLLRHQWMDYRKKSLFLIILFFNIIIIFNKNCLELFFFFICVSLFVSEELFISVSQ